MPLTENFNQDTNGNITTVGTGIAGTPAGGVVTIQGATGMTPVNITKPPASTATLGSVASSATTVVLLAANANRKGFLLYNSSPKTCNVAFAATASTVVFTFLMQANSFYESDGINYSGVISGIWASASGTMQVTELT